MVDSGQTILDHLVHSIRSSWLLLNRSNKKLPLRGAGTRQWGRIAVAGLTTLIVVLSLTHYRLMKCTYTLTCARTACTRHGTYKASWVWRINYGNIMSYSDEQMQNKWNPLSISWRISRFIFMSILTFKNSELHLLADDHWARKG